MNKMRFSPSSLDYEKDANRLCKQEFRKKHGEDKVSYWDRANHERINYDDHQEDFDYEDDYNR